ncbi:MAG TPA: glutaminyl-peptide cyclotransferase [Blastocatellia bacterium]|nr:glutaminyl-peptide cyclotransferase [Blastocatellia bacterium]
MLRLLLVLQILLSLLGQAPKPARTPRPGVKAPEVRIAMTALKPEAVYEVPGAPDWLAIDESVWVSNYPKNTVAKLDPKSSKVLATITVGSKPCSGLAVGFGSLWVPLCGDQALARVDLKEGKVTATIPIGIADSEGGLAAGAESIWLMTDKKGTLARIDPATNKVVAEIQVPAGSYTVAFGEGAVWVTGTGSNVLTRINPETNLVVETIPVGKAPRFLTIGGGYVWTLNQANGDVSKVDPKTNKVVETIEVGVPGPGGEIAFGEGSVWVTSFEFPITRIDPASGKVVQQFAGEGGDAIRVGLGSVWLSNIRAGTVWRLDPRRIAATVAQ